MASRDTKQLSNNNFMVIMVLITVLVVGVAALAGHYLWSNISLNYKVIAAKNTANRQAQSDVQAAPSLMTSYNNLGAQQTLLADALPNTIDFPSILVEMQNITNTAGATLKMVSPNTSATSGVPSMMMSGSTSPTMAPTAQVYPFAVEVSCSYASLQTMMGDLEQSARPIRVTGVQISGSGSSITAQINMNTYYQSEAMLPFGMETVK